MIKVKLYSIFREAVGKDQLDFNSDTMTVKEILDYIFSKYSDAFKERRYYIDLRGYPSNIVVYVHGKMLRLDEGSLSLKLKTGDVIHILEVISGG